MREAHVRWTGPAEHTRSVDTPSTTRWTSPVHVRLIARPVDTSRQVRDIHPSPEIVSSMEMQMAAERKKRAAILQSEGEKAALINAAEGRREVR